MKKYLLTVLSILLACIFYGQENIKNYNDLIEKGRSLYSAKDYKNAAITFTTVINLAGYQTSVLDRHRAAF